MMRDYLSAISLAGAAEEILGKMLEARGGKHSLAVDASATGVVYEDLMGEPLSKKDAIGGIEALELSLLSAVSENMEDRPRRRGRLHISQKAF